MKFLSLKSMFTCFPSAATFKQNKPATVVTFEDIPLVAIECSRSKGTRGGNVIFDYNIATPLTGRRVFLLLLLLHRSTSSAREAKTLFRRVKFHGKLPGTWFAQPGRLPSSFFFLAFTSLLSFPRPGSAGASIKKLAAATDVTVLLRLIIAQIM